jgi:hypothetical protein
MKNVLLPLFFVALSQLCQASDLVSSPDRRWTLQTTTREGNPAIAIFDSDDRPAVILYRDTTGDGEVVAKWSADSKKVVLLAQAPLGSGITAAWFDGTNWHATTEPDNDLSHAKALAKIQVVTGDVKAEERALGDWISPDTIQIHGTLRYMDGKEFPYSYELQIIPGTYPVNRGGFETGGLQAFHFQAGS